MQILVLFLAMLALLPIRGEKDALFRLELAEAIAGATDDLTEQLTLVRLARYESGFDRRVARCERLGDRGTSFGTYQIKPMSRADAKNVCGTPAEQTEVALRYVRRSGEVCPKNQGASTLHMYVSGLCVLGPEAHALAVHRWGGTIFHDVFPEGN